MDIEKGIRPLVEAIGRLGFASTVYSCEGHFGQKQNELFLPTAYVTFSISDLKSFRRSYERMRGLDGMLGAASLRLTYDCILGRYTLSIWPEESLATPIDQRAAVDSAITRLSEGIRSYAEGSAACAKASDTVASDTVASDRVTSNRVLSNGPFPCGDSLPPCALVIPPKPVVCPFGNR